jgi:diacylglycerol kinase (ATP)
MQATLIFNPNAGNAYQISREELQAALTKGGYEPVHTTTESEDDLDKVLAQATGLVVVAGGDGTVRAVATRLIGKDVALALLPMGSANNISRTLGIAGSPLEIIAGLNNPTRCYFDLGYLNSPWGVDYFLEAFGVGFFADTLARYNPEDGKSVLRGLSAAAHTLANYEAQHYQIRLDGLDLSGRYLMVEVLNTTAFGPRLKFAPSANPADGMFEVIRVREEAREDLLRFLMSLVNESLEDLSCVEITRGHRLEIAWNGFPTHVDGEIRPLQLPVKGKPSVNGARSLSAELPDKIRVEVIPQAIEFWLPEEVSTELAS